MAPTAVRSLSGLIERTLTFARDSQAGRYTQVGGLCAVANNVVVIGLNLAGIPLPLALAIGFIGVTALAYILHALYTFRIALSLAAMARFYFANGGSFCLAAAFMAMLCRGLGLGAPIALPITTGVMFLWNFVSARYALSKRFRTPA
jgi:putative flippase GtrA